MHRRVFITGVWHSGTRLIAKIAEMNGYNLGKIINSKNDNIYAWHGPKVALASRVGATSKNVYDPNSIKAMLEKNWPLDSVSSNLVGQFRAIIEDSEKTIVLRQQTHCCNIPGLTLLTPLISKSYPQAPIINVVRNGIDLSLSDADNYFLGRLLRDKLLTRYISSHDGAMTPESALKLLFTALGDLEWTPEFLENYFIIKHARKPIHWKVLASLRWALIMDRLRTDLESYNIDNHHAIKFENIVLGDEREIKKLRHILGVQGNLKLPTMDKAKAFKYGPYITHILSNKSRRGDAQRTLELMYKICKPHLKAFRYDKTIDFFEDLSSKYSWGSSKKEYC